MASEATAGGEPERRSLVGLVAGQVPRLSTGERALLRRNVPGRRYQADGLVVKLLHLAGASPARYMRDFEAWRLVAHVAAVLSGTGGQPPYSFGRRLGEALQAAGFSENRLLRLTSSRGEPLFDQIRLLARLLAQNGQVPVNLGPLFHLAACDRAEAERARIQIAQEYYVAAARADKGDKE